MIARLGVYVPLFVCLECVSVSVHQRAEVHALSEHNSRLCVYLLFVSLFCLTGSLKRTLEEDEDFGSMQVTAAHNG